MRTVIPRIRKSLRERGVVASISRSALLPIHLFQEYRKQKKHVRVHVSSDFDQQYQLDTDGEFNGWTYLSDLKIPSQNWIYGRNYAPIEPARFSTILASLAINFEDFVFLDFGSGKGRALLLASEYPFKLVVGVEFSPELHAAAEANIKKYAEHRRSGAVESVCMDFLNFRLPEEPLLLFFFDPCEDRVLTELFTRIQTSVEGSPRPAYLVYVAPTTSKKLLLENSSWLVPIESNSELNFVVYGNKNILLR